MKKLLRYFSTFVFAVLITLNACSYANALQTWPPSGSKNAPVFCMSERSKTSTGNNRSAQAAGLRNSSINLPDNTEESSNWAGYIVTPVSGKGYTAVSGKWTVPIVSSGQTDLASAQWIGLGGVSTSDLLQIGTVEYTGRDSQTDYELFYEVLPDTAQYVASISAGSTVSVSISQSSDTGWKLNYTITDSSGQGTSDSIPVTLDPAYSEEIGTSAEWISEDPSSDNGRLYPLADTGTVSYSSATVDGQALDASGNGIQPVAMVSGSQIAIAPSALGADGMSFTTSTSTVESSAHKSGQSLGNSRVQPQRPGRRAPKVNVSVWGWGWDIGWSMGW